LGPYCKLNGPPINVLATLTTVVWGLGTLASNYKRPTNGVPLTLTTADRLYHVLPKGRISPPKWAWLGSRDRFWATVCKTVRPMLSESCLSVCLSCLSVLSVTLAYCGQTVECIKMKLCMQVGFGPGHVVRCGPSSPSPCCGQTAGWIKMPLGTEVDLGPGGIVLHGDPAPPKGGAQYP